MRNISSHSPDLRFDCRVPFNLLELRRRTHFFKVILTLPSDSKILLCIRINNETCYDFSYDLAEMGWYLRFYILNNLPDDTDAIGPRTTH